MAFVILWVEGGGEPVQLINGEYQNTADKQIGFSIDSISDLSSLPDCAAGSIAYTPEHVSDPGSAGDFVAAKGPALTWKYKEA